MCLRWLETLNSGGYTALRVEKSAISVENRASGKRRQRRELDDRALSAGQAYARRVLSSERVER
jgi:hypothetical protein